MKTSRVLFLVKRIAAKTGLQQKQVAAVLEVLGAEIIRELRADRPGSRKNLRLLGGSFKIRSRKARRVLNPQTEEPMQLGQTFRVMWRGPSLKMKHCGRCMACRTTGALHGKTIGSVRFGACEDPL